MSERPDAQPSSHAPRPGSEPACGLCRRPVDHHQAARARLGWRSLVVCDRCFDAAGTPADLSPAA